MKDELCGHFPDSDAVVTVVKIGLTLLVLIYFYLKHSLLIPGEDV